MTDGTTLEQRVARLEARTAITQLAARYAIALDGRDINSIVALYVPDIKVGSSVHKVGREALTEWFYGAVHYWYRSIHHIGGHVITLEDADHAHGTVQCRIEQEIGSRWVTTVVLYDDSYERRDGEWLFAHRHGQPIWCYDHGDDPVARGFEELPGGMPIRLPAEYPEFFEFWQHFSEDEVRQVTHRPVGPPTD